MCPLGGIATPVRRPFPIREVTEGAARILVPDVPRRRGPGKAGPWPFYNPTMAVNRDLSAIVLARWPRPIGSALDGLAATGAWGIRMALEAHITGLTFNDRSSMAAMLVRENLRRNRVDARVVVGDLTTHLATASYGFVDIDPFGPPSPFLAAAFRSDTSTYGLGITATDTAVLCGTYPDACTRRYDARPLRCPQGAEIGLRILLGYCARLAGERGSTISPVLSFAAEHFLRTFLLVEKRRATPPVGHLVRRRPGEFVPAGPEAADAIGPLWTGPLHEPAVVRSLVPSPWSLPSTARLLATLQAEADLPAYFVTTDELAAAARGSPPGIERLLDGLRSAGYRAARTHFHPRGVRTDAPYDEVVRIFRARMPTGSTDGSAPAS